MADSVRPPSSGAALIETRSLSFSFGERRIIDGVSVAVGRGEFVGLIGPNGAGKTTLLRLMIGLLAARAGEVLLEGRPLAGYSARERARRISYLSQGAGTAFPFPVIDVVLMGRYPFLNRWRGESEADLEKARRALAYVGLQGFEGRYFNELSGGERQLALFARVLAQETELLLLDEPTSNLDIKHQDQFFSMAFELTREKKAVIAAVHNLDIASRYCSRLVLLHRGAVVAAGGPDEVLRCERLDPVYGTRTVVTRNESTGTLVVNVAPRRQPPGGSMPRIHLIGGAGSAVNLTRQLVRLGYRVSGGVAHAFDADQKLWSSLEIPCVVIDAFSRITKDDLAKAAGMVKAADLAILCSFPVGPGNAGNLELASLAPRLIVLRPEAREEGRKFFSAQAQRSFTRLCRGAELMSHRELSAAIESGRILAAG